MQTLTIKQARTILGTTADAVPDAVLENYIETATLLKDIFFTTYRNEKKKPELTCYSKPNVP
jgi:hypothetical protein